MSEHTKGDLVVVQLANPDGWIAPLAGWIEGRSGEVVEVRERPGGPQYLVKFGASFYADMKKANDPLVSDYYKRAYGGGDHWICKGEDLEKGATP